MFGYYGSKSKIIDNYPAPKYDKIIEPFAGSARYSLKWFDREITIVDKYSVVISIWEYLQNSSKSDILGLPKLKTGDDIRDFNLSKTESLFLAFMLSAGISQPQYKVSKYRANVNLKNISDNLYKIRHWDIILGDYKELENISATWFIDPPYISGGHKYKENKIDYISLGNWCKTRSGQVIVCEGRGAEWLEFNPLLHTKGLYNNNVELIWSNMYTGYEHKQLTLF